MPSTIRSVLWKILPSQFLLSSRFFRYFLSPSTRYIFLLTVCFYFVFAFAPDSEVSGIEQYNKMCVYAEEVILEAALHWHDQHPDCED